MKSAPAKLRPLLALAAELRAGGTPWEAVAARVKRRPDTCRRWPDEYPDDWRQAYAEAERRMLADAGSEAVLVMRRLLRSEDDKVCRDVARTLAALRADLRKSERRAGPERSDDSARLAAFVGGLDDAQVQALIDELLERRAGAGGGAGAGRPDAGPVEPG
jgi:hypothetical protein